MSGTRVAVLGDLTVDWAILVGGGVAGLQLPYQWERRDTLNIVGMPGGAGLLALALSSINGSLDVVGPVIPPQALQEPGFEGVTRTYATWTPRTVSAAATAWKQDQFLGISAASDPGPQPAPASLPDLVVIDDANLGFRDATTDWASLVREIADGRIQVLLKMVPPLGSGPLWDALIAANPEGLVVYLTAADLRKENAPIGQPLSWERTAQEAVAAVRDHPALRQAAAVVVGLGLSGAAVVPRSGPADLVYDPAFQEGDWEAAHPGLPYAVGTSVAASVASALSEGGPSKLVAGLVQGLELARALHLDGPKSEGAFDMSSPAIQAVLAPDARSSFCCREIGEAADWRLLGGEDRLEYRRLAESTVEKGIRGAASDIPIERMGAWASVDRREIESIRSIRHIVREYLGGSVRPRPLNLSVFGPPGSGKSFAIKQMTSEWRRDGAQITVLEFNISQLHDDSGLATAFQRVRDCAVEGSLPLVFFDEFDSARNGQELGWLAQFLAPMQDGTFLEGSLVRPIGPAIFVFAGGTHPTIESFKTRAQQIPGAKATDFLSRLRGYIDVLGPNPSSPADESFVVRRAFLLRQVLERRAPQVISDGVASIDAGVMNAFLSAPSYVHGARSLESIIEMSALSGRSRFERSSLPAAHQLSLHVDAGEFLSLLGRGG